MDDFIGKLNHLKNSVDALRHAFNVINDIAPSKQEYDSLTNSDSSLIKSLFNSQDVKLDDPAIKFAIEFKELFSNGKLGYLNKLLDGEEIAWEAENKPNGAVCTEASDIKDHTIEETKFKELSIVNEVPIEEIIHLDIDDRNRSKLETVDSIHRRTRKPEIVSTENIPRPPEIRDTNLLNKIFTHQSIISNIQSIGSNKTLYNNERLEFLGDAFLGFLVSIIIYERFPDFSEGQMSMLRSDIVCNKNLIEWSKLYKFDKSLKTNFNESVLTGDQKLYADVFEAYLGGLVEKNMMETEDGITNVTDFMTCWFNSKSWIEILAESRIQAFEPQFYYKMQFSKTAKQEIRLLLGMINVPEYVRVDLGDRTFVSGVKVLNKVYGYGIGTSHQESDARAATDAMKNPMIKKICPKECWSKFEASVGLNESGGLNFTEGLSLVSPEQLEILSKEIAIKFKSGNIQLLNSENNPTVLLIDDSKRDTFNREINALHDIEDIDNDSPYYSSRHTRGRGGVFDGVENKMVRKKREKVIEGGIIRNKQYQLAESRTIIQCHEVMVDITELDKDSKNKMNAIFAKRGAAPDYRMYRTDDGNFLCELWFGNQQVVSYGFAPSKRDASQLAAQLAYIREEYFGYDEL